MNKITNKKDLRERNVLNTNRKEDEEKDKTRPEMEPDNKISKRRRNLAQ